LDGCEEIVVAFVVSGCDGSEVFEFVEEALDGVALAVNPSAEREGFDTVGHGADVGPGAALGDGLAQRVRIAGAVG
jgi:hypothetical protein